MCFDGERRAVERTWINGEALLSIARLKGVYCCRVRDLSSDGAGLRLNNLPLLPNEFSLSHDGFRTTLACRLVWREGDFAGVAFL